MMTIATANPPADNRSPIISIGGSGSEGGVGVEPVVGVVVEVVVGLVVGVVVTVAVSSITLILKL